MSDTTKFRSLKIWETHDHRIIWQLSPAPLLPQMAKKLFLTIDVNQMTKGISLTSNKPKFIIKPGSLTQILRKNLNGMMLNSISYDSESKSYVIELNRPSAQGDGWMIALHGTKPPELELIDRDNESSYLRWSTKGMYTKRKDIDQDNFNFKNLKDMTGPLIESIRTNADESLEPQDQSSKDTASVKSASQRSAIQKMRRRLRTLKKSLDKIEAKSISSSDLSNWQEQTKLLEEYAYLATDGDHCLLLSPEQSRSNESITIELNPNKSIGENVNEYHRKHKKMKLSITSQEQQKQCCLKDIAEIEKDLQYLLDHTISEQESLDILSRHKISAPAKTGRAKVQYLEKKPYKLYLSTDNTRILVGKGAAENDRLTKQAKSNDFWIHAVGVTGSHVIVDGSKFRKTMLPEKVFRDAAILALHFSKLRNDFSGEVYYTRKQHIKKSKGMPPGLWNVEHSPVAFVKYSEPELKDILNRQEA